MKQKDKKDKKDKKDEEAPFGGIVVVFSGDFRQVLPVVKRANPAAIVAITIKKSKLWRKVCPALLIRLFVACLCALECRCAYCD